MDYGGHDSRFERNYVVTLPYDGQNCLNVGTFRPGHGDHYVNNTCVLMPPVKGAAAASVRCERRREP